LAKKKRRACEARRLKANSSNQHAPCSAFAAKSQPETAVAPGEPIPPDPVATHYGFWRVIGFVDRTAKHALYAGAAAGPSSKSASMRSRAASAVVRILESKAAHLHRIARDFDEIADAIEAEGALS
jgi:hypothetical protein